jgi:hypothetical protein
LGVPHEREARITPHLPGGAPFRTWRFAIDDGDWIALGFDVIDGREAAIPWSTRDLDRVLAAHLVMAERLDPSPTPVEPAGELWGDSFARWHDFAHDDALAHALPDGWVRLLDQLADLEAAWPAYTDGEHLVHLDLRADNVLLTATDVYAGMLTHLALSDASPALRDLRRLHAEQAAEARRWLARRRRWDDVAS